MINGSQITVCWHVNNLKVSHIDPEEVRKMMSIIENQFGYRDPKSQSIPYHERIFWREYCSLWRIHKLCHKISIYQNLDECWKFLMIYWEQNNHFSPHCRKAATRYQTHTLGYSTHCSIIVHTSKVSKPWRLEEVEMTPAIYSWHDRHA